MSINHMSPEEFFKKWNDIEKQLCPCCGLYNLDHQLLLNGQTWTYCTTCDSPTERRPDLESRVIARWKDLKAQLQEKPHEH
jgi:hypothetical protein